MTNTPVEGDALDGVLLLLAALAGAMAQLLIHTVALVLTLSGWRPAPATPAAPAPVVHPLHDLLAVVSTRDLRAACRSAGRQPGKSQATALATLMA